MSSASPGVDEHAASEQDAGHGDEEAGHADTHWTRAELREIVVG